MRAVRLFKPGDLRCVEVPKPQVKEKGDVLIKIKACGVCGSDLERVMVKGAYKHPITIGHEFSGVVEEVFDEDQGIEKGDRVTVMPLIPCKSCDYCKIGQYVFCEDYLYYGSRIDGAMAEYLVVKSENILKLPLNVDFEMGSMTDPASVALHAVRKAVIIPGQSAVVFGLGPIGFLALQWLKAVGATKIIAVDILDEKLGLADYLGADTCINAKSEDVIKVIRDNTRGNGVDVAVELSGSKTAQVQAIEAVRNMGKVIYCGISYDDLLIPNNSLNRILRGELVLMGAWNSLNSPLPVNEWQSSLDFMASGRIKCLPLISHRFRLEECQEAFDMMYNRKEIFNKVIFKPEMT